MTAGMSSTKIIIKYDQEDTSYRLSLKWLADKKIVRKM